MKNILQSQNHFRVNQEQVIFRKWFGQFDIHIQFLWTGSHQKKYHALNVFQYFHFKYTLHMWTINVHHVGAISIAKEYEYATTIYFKLFDSFLPLIYGSYVFTYNDRIINSITLEYEFKREVCTLHVQERFNFQIPVHLFFWKIWCHEKFTLVRVVW